MRVISVGLHNIRSYADEVIEFPEGTTLLSGDIGSGKSSILLAIEFALFGILRAGLSGTALLRHGATNGSVELKAIIDGKKVAIFRALKRSKDTVTQDKGYLVVDGEKFEGTPVELKARILSLIGYPDDLVSKSKSLIYRYTVYTPQEEMKSILFEGNDARLDTLRRIFDIDKYKRIKENSAILTREMRTQKKMFESRLEGSDEVEEKLKAKKADKKSSEEKLKKIDVSLGALKKKVEVAKKAVSNIEKQTEDRYKAEKAHDVASASLQSKSERLESMKKEIQTLEKDLKEAPAEAGDMKKIEAEITAVKSAIDTLEEGVSGAREKEAKHTANKERAEKLVKEIRDLDECPVCRQDVTEEHADKVEKDQKVEINKAAAALKTLADYKKKAEEKLNVQKEKLSKLREQEKALAAADERLKSFKEKQERKTVREKDVAELKSTIKQLESEVKTHKSELEKTKDLAVAVVKAKDAYETERESLNDLEKEQLSLKKEIEAFEESMKEFQERMEKFKESKKKLVSINENLEWMEKFFVNIIDAMEKQVMLRIYGEFNEYFVEWFSTLMEDESITVRLDEGFAPVVTQDGYETSVENLSGGEKTSVALAYRLSLNKVINDFISTIKTKDLIILDEPTDGFSSEQLDRVREVLAQLDIDQTIVVSHEPKLESYADSVIRIVKNENTSALA